jgi:hypothetical protein
MKQMMKLVFGAGLALAAMARTVAPLRAQTTGTTPVWVDPSTQRLRLDPKKSHLMFVDEPSCA